jgi:hypothetical protein
LDAITYYKDRFGHELLHLIESTTSTIKDRISIVHLLPPERPFIRQNEQTKIFQEKTYKSFFLYCFFFSALLDQAIHSGLRSEHSYFDKLARYPKFVGILGTFHTNIHPALLLLASTLYIPASEEESALNEFRKLCDFFVKDYCDFFENEYPKITGRLDNLKDRKNAITAVLCKMSNAMALLFVPMSLKPYSSLQPKTKLYESMVLSFSTRINSKLSQNER